MLAIGAAKVRVRVAENLARMLVPSCTCVCLHNAIDLCAHKFRIITTFCMLWRECLCVCMLGELRQLDFGYIHNNNCAHGHGNFN